MSIRARHAADASAAELHLINLPPRHLRVGIHLPAALRLHALHDVARQQDAHVVRGLNAHAVRCLAVRGRDTNAVNSLAVRGPRLVHVKCLHLWERQLDAPVHQLDLKRAVAKLAAAALCHLLRIHLTEFLLINADRVFSFIVYYFHVIVVPLCRFAAPPGCTPRPLQPSLNRKASRPYAG